MKRLMSVGELREDGFAVYVGPAASILGTVAYPIAAFGSLGEALGFIANKMAPPEKPKPAGDGERMVGGTRPG